MSYEVSIVADSISPAGARLTTFQLRYPMKVHWDFLTHRVFSRNASSGRAISVSRFVKWTAQDPARPMAWVRDAVQMKSGGRLDDETAARADAIWQRAFEDACRHALELDVLGVHRQDANALLMPFGWINVCLTSTSFDNFFALRVDPDARPEMQKLAVLMARAYRAGTSAAFEAGWWHLPYVTVEELADLCRARARGNGRTVAVLADLLRKCSVARCARVSYKTREGKIPATQDDLALHDRLLASGHWSPAEHQATPADDASTRSGNFRGWLQYRQTLPVSVHESFDYSILDRDYADRDFIV